MTDTKTWHPPHPIPVRPGIYILGGNMGEPDDPVSAIKLIDSMTKMAEELKGMTPDMSMVMGVAGDDEVRHSHPVEDMEQILSVCRGALLSVYGRMLYDTPDNPIEGAMNAKTFDKSDSEEDVSSVSKKVLSDILEGLEQARETKASADGDSVRSGPGDESTSEGARILRGVLKRTRGE